MSRRGFRIMPLPHNNYIYMPAASSQEQRNKDAENEQQLDSFSECTTDEEETLPFDDSRLFHYAAKSAAKSEVTLASAASNFLSLGVGNLRFSLGAADAAESAFTLTCAPLVSSRWWSATISYILTISAKDTEVELLLKSGQLAFNDACVKRAITHDLAADSRQSVSIVKLSVTVTKLSGIPQQLISHFHKTDLTDAVLHVEDKELHVNKGFLAIHSTFFHNAFFKGYAEAEAASVELGDFKYKEVEHFLRVLYPEQKRIGADAVEYLMRLADFFDCPVVLRACIDVLVKSPDVPVAKKLRLGDQYNAPEVLNHCFETLKKSGDLKKLAHSEDVRQCSDRLQAHLFHLLADQCRCNS